MIEKCLDILTILLIVTTATHATNSCPSLISPANGAVQESGPLGIFTCRRPHFKIAGTANQTRTQIWCRNGRWDRLPTCEAKQTCGSLRKIQNGDFRITGHGPGDEHSPTRARAMFKCNPGYFFAGRFNRSWTQYRDGRGDFDVHCLFGPGSSVKWSTPRRYRVGKCLARKDCNKYPASISHGSYRGGCCSHNDVMEYSCNRGYTIIGNKYVKCMDGKWSKTPYCTDAATCQLTGIPFGTVLTYSRRGRNFENGDEVSISCLEGWFFSMSKRDTSSSDTAYNYGGSYNGNDYTGQVDENKYTFDVTPRNITCLNTGRWSNQQMPVCKAFTCEVPSVTGGTWNVRQSRVRHGENITITCNEGYIATGYQSMKCNIGDAERADGWNVHAPKCKQIRCPATEAPKNGIIVGRNTARGAIVTFTCNRGFERFGSANRTCQGNARWSGTEATCQPTDKNAISDCPVPIVPFGGSSEKIPEGSDYSIGDRIRFTCHNNYILFGPKEIRCVPVNATTRLNRVHRGRWEPLMNPKCEVWYSFDDESKLAKNFDKLQKNYENITKPHVIDHATGRRLELNTAQGLDITFLIDGSGSITPKEFGDAKEFVKYFVKKIGVSEGSNGARVAVTAFAGDLEKDFKTSNGFNTYPPRKVSLIGELLDRLKYESGGTNIKGALDYFQKNMLPINRFRRETAKQYLFILSDGEANTGGSPKQVAKSLREVDGVEIFCIKIGSDDTKQSTEINTNLLIDISSEADMNTDPDNPDQHFFKLQTYNTFGELTDMLLNGTVNYGHCGVPGETGITAGNIVGGTLAIPGAWPWMVAVMESQANEAPIEDYKQVCGGSLLNNEWVLTAAHCFQGGSYNNKLRIMVKLGTNNKKETSMGRPDKVFDLRLESMHLHEDWVVDPVTKKKEDSNFTNDIALLRLQIPVEYRRNIRRICLPSVDEEVQDRKAWVAGWGKVSNTSLDKVQEENAESSDELRQVELPVVTHEEDQVNCPRPEEKVICAGSNNVIADSCGGDSGGPLMIKKYNEKMVADQFYALGIVSNGYGCAFKSHHGFGRYTDVRQYLDWIKLTIKSAGSQL